MAFNISDNFQNRLFSFYDFYRVRHAVDYCIAFNRGNRNPYHNYSHVEMMLCRLIDMVKSSTDLDRLDVQILIISILFHDFDHSGGKTSDAENIQAAIAGFRHFVNQKQSEFADIYAERIEDYIRSTEYPCPRDLSSSSDYPLGKDILHDLDRMMGVDLIEMLVLDEDYSQPLETDYFHTALAQWNGLHIEMRKSDKTLEFEDFTYKNLQFISNVKWKTEYGKKAYKEQEAKIQRLLTNKEAFSDFIDLMLTYIDPVY